MQEVEASKAEADAPNCCALRLAEVFATDDQTGRQAAAQRGVFVPAVVVASEAFGWCRSVVDDVVVSDDFAVASVQEHFWFCRVEVTVEPAALEVVRRDPGEEHGRLAPSSGRCASRCGILQRDLRAQIDLSLQVCREVIELNNWPAVTAVRGGGPANSGGCRPMVVRSAGAMVVVCGGGPATAVDRRCWTVVMAAMGRGRAVAADGRVCMAAVVAVGCAGAVVVAVAVVAVGCASAVVVAVAVGCASAVVVVGVVVVAVAVSRAGAVVVAVAVGCAGAVAVAAVRIHVVFGRGRC